MRVKSNWCLSLNFGDVLTPYIVQKITGELPYYLDLEDKREKVVMAGSTLHWCDKNCVAWGSGVCDVGNRLKPGVKIRAVRGPISREIAAMDGIDCDVMGDPALVLPRLYKPKSGQRAKLGFVPHYIEQDGVFDLVREAEGMRTINVFDPVEKVVDDICGCDAILSSSLHGLIVADAYGVPSRWMRVTDRLCGDGTKFRDYYASIGIENAEPMEFLQAVIEPVDDIVRQIPKNEVKLDVDKLLAVKPF